jgi:DNA repair exonuclease SbcCD ATPase subunit
LEELKAEHASTLEIDVGSLNKHINKLNLELKATQDDLAKAKTSLETSRGDIESLTQQRDDARTQADAAPAVNPEQAAEFSRLVKELESVKDELAKTTDRLTLTKSTMVELSDNHEKELEAAAKGRADEVLQLRAAHDAEVSDLATQKTELLVKYSDMEGDLATIKAALAAHEATSPKTNGMSHPPSPGVPREELQKLHEAHNLKIHDMQADHDKALKLAKEELESALNKINDLQQDLARKDMEIQYLEQEEEESQERITRYFDNFLSGIPSNPSLTDSRQIWRPSRKILNLHNLFLCQFSHFPSV